MKLSKTELLHIIKEEIQRYVEAAAPTGAKPGKEVAEVKGTLNTKALATALDVDATKLDEAYRAARTGSRSSTHNAILADVFVKLLEAPQNVKANVMNMLRAVKGEGKD